MGLLNSMNVLQAAMVMQKLRIIDSEAWQLASTNILKLLHKYKGRDMTKIIDLFDQDVLDDEGEPLPVRKIVDESFFERITGIIPIHIKHLAKE